MTQGSKRPPQATVSGAGDATGAQRFKFNVKRDWNQNHGGTNKNVVAKQT